MSENLHTVTVTVVDADHDARVEFHCAGDETAPCHQYPDCACQSWDDDHEHPNAPHARCWIAAWFDTDSTEYVGADADDIARPTVAHAGPITLSGVGDWDYLTWEWAS